MEEKEWPKAFSLGIPVVFCLGGIISIIMSMSNSTPEPKLEEPVVELTQTATDEQVQESKTEIEKKTEEPFKRLDPPKPLVPVKLIVSSSYKYPCLLFVDDQIKGQISPFGYLKITLKNKKYKFSTRLIKDGNTEKSDYFSQEITLNKGSTNIISPPGNARLYLGAKVLTYGDALSRNSGYSIGLIPSNQENLFEIEEDFDFLEAPLSISDTLKVADGWYKPYKKTLYKYIREKYLNLDLAYSVFVEHPWLYSFKNRMETYEWLRLRYNKARVQLSEKWQNGLITVFNSEKRSYKERAGALSILLRTKGSSAISNNFSKLSTQSIKLLAEKINQHITFAIDNKFFFDHKLVEVIKALKSHSADYEYIYTRYENNNKRMNHVIKTGILSQYNKPKGKTQIEEFIKNFYNWRVTRSFAKDFKNDPSVMKYIENNFESFRAGARIQIMKFLKTKAIIKKAINDEYADIREMAYSSAMNNPELRPIVQKRTESGAQRVVKVWFLNSYSSKPKEIKDKYPLIQFVKDKDLKVAKFALDRIDSEQFKNKEFTDLLMTSEHRDIVSYIIYKSKPSAEVLEKILSRKDPAIASLAFYKLASMDIDFSKKELLISFWNRIDSVTKSKMEHHFITYIRKNIN